MPRVYSQTKSRRGRERRCERAGCGHVIQPGETYYRFEFRYGGEHFYCKSHYPKRSELTQSKMASIYAAIEDAEASMVEAEGADDIRDIVQTVVDSVREVAEEYREAAEPFQGQGEFAERADDLESWADELDGFYPDDAEEVEEWDEESFRLDLRAEYEVADEEDLDEEQAEEFEDRVREAEKEHAEALERREETLEGARNDAQELFDACPY